jgi:hypothetical protein
MEARARGEPRALRPAADQTGGYIHAAFCLHEMGRTDEAREVLLGGPAHCTPSQPTITISPVTSACSAIWTCISRRALSSTRSTAILPRATRILPRCKSIAARTRRLPRIVSRISAKGRPGSCPQFEPLAEEAGRHFCAHALLQVRGALLKKRNLPTIRDLQSAIRNQSSRPTGTTTRSFREEMRKVTGRFVTTSPSTSTGTSSSLRTMAFRVWKYSTSGR